MFSAVLFDMDGVLIDSHPLHFHNWRRILTEAGRHPTDGHLAVLFEGATRMEILQRLLGDLTDQEIEHFCRRKEQLFREGEETLRTVPGVHEFLDTVEAAGIPKAVVTSASRSRSERLLKRFQLRDRFPLLITGESVSNGKDDPEIFRVALERLQTPAGDCLLIEDSPAAIRSAYRLGMPSFGVAPDSRASQLSLAGAAFVAPNFKNLTFDQLQEMFAKAEMSEGDGGAPRFPGRRS